MAYGGALDFALIEEAARFLRSRVRETPVERSPALDERLGGRVWLKLESLQLTGSFKLRGAWFKLSTLSSSERARGVASCSAGNHGKGLAYAARDMGLEATVYVPRSIDAAKARGISELGARLERSAFDGFDDTEVWARAEAERRGQCYVSAFDDAAIVAGNGGSLALETLGQVPATRFIVPVGGGGLGAGFALALEHARPGSTLVVVQHEQSAALLRSMERGVAQTTMPAVETIAGGLEGGIGASNFEVLRSRVSEVVTVSERAIREAVVWMLDAHQLLVEPSAASVVAACLSGAIAPSSADTALVISGRNVATGTLAALLAR